MDKKFTIMLLSLMFVATSLGARLTQKQMTFVTEFGVLVTDLTSVEILDAGTATTSTIYSDRTGQTSLTNPIVTGLGSGLITFWSKDADYRCTATNDVRTRTVDNMTGSDGRFAFPTYLVDMSSRVADDDQTFAFGDQSDWVLAAQDKTFDATPAVDDSVFAIGTASFTSDLLLYGASGYHLIWDASEYTLELKDNTIFAVGEGDDYTISHNGSATTVTGAFTCSGIPTFSTDVIFDGTYNIKYDDDRYQLHFQDSAVLGIGGAADAVGDITFVHNGTDFLMEAATADDLWKIGETTNFDVAIYGDTNTDFVYFDTDSELVYLDGFDMRFNDDDMLKFGDDSDFTIDSGTTKVLDFTPGAATDDYIVNFGLDQSGVDIKAFGTTSGDYMEWDASADQFKIVGDIANFTLTEAAADAFMVDCTGTSDTWVISLETSEGGIQLLADGDTEGDIDIDAEDDITITAAGDFTLAVTGTTILPDDVLLRTVVAVTANEADNLAATQKELVAAVAGKTHEFVKVIVALDWGGTAYTESDDNLVVRYTDGSGVIVSDVIEATGLADATEDTVCFAGPAPTTSALVTEAASTNKALVLDNSGNGEWGNSGDSPLVVITYYRTHTTAELGL